MPADPLAAYEGLRRRLNIMLCLEGVRLRAGRQMVIVDLVAFPLEQIERFQPVGAGMVFHHHSMKFGAFGCMGRHSLIPSI